MNIILNYKEEKSIDKKIKELVAAGKMDDAIAVTEEFMQNPLYRYCKNELEEKINDIAYSLLMKNKLNEANTFFFMNTKFFPHSANAFDSYAECLYRLGKKEDAIKNYEIAISKDPKGITGDNSRKMLAMIKGKQ
jgi:tetratricopeptide (TPR) repeat protein